MDHIGNDNDTHRPIARGPEPDAHGQAAMLLVESLIHGLIAKSVIDVRDALNVLEVAADVKAEIAADLGDSPATMHRSLALLAAIGQSLRTDDVEP